MRTRMLARLQLMIRSVLFAATLLVLALPLSTSAAEPKSKPAKATADGGQKKPERSALDDALLKDLDNELLEGAGDLPKGAKGRPAETPRVESKPGAPEGDKADVGEDVGAPGADEDPLTRISQEMRSAEDLMREVRKRASAEQVQKRIVEDLAALIEQAEKQAAQQQASSSKEKKSQKTAKRQPMQQPSRGQSGKESNKPAKDSTDRLGKAEDARPDPKQLKDMMKDSWGHLPPHAREQMSQNWPERFLPQYELMIERYYKRLAEEQGGK